MRFSNGAQTVSKDLQAWVTMVGDKHRLKDDAPELASSLSTGADLLRLRLPT